MGEEKIEVEVLSVDYIELRPTLRKTVTHTLVTATVDGRFITLEIPRKVEEKDELLDEILKEAKKPRSPLEGKIFEVEKERLGGE